MKTNRFLFLILLIVPILALTSCKSRLFFSRNDEIKDGEAKGEIVLNAIEKYYVDNNAYPASLDNLIPDYIEKIPVTIAGSPIEYKAEGDSYTVAFKTLDMGRSKSTCVYDKRLPFWDCSFYIGEQ